MSLIICIHTKGRRYTVETLTKAAKEARAAYVREYRAKETPEQKERRREYAREWRKANPEKVAAARVRYWNKKAKESCKNGA